MSAARIKKEAYFAKLIGLFQEYTKCFIVNVDMVGSKQLQDVRMALRGKGEMIMGKNTMIRKCLRDNIDQMPNLETLITHIGGNTGFVFFACSFDEIRDILKAAFVENSARAGILAPVSVKIAKQITTLQPTETAFFQALNINTKITKGAIEILEDIKIVTEGTRVSPGAAALLQKLGMKPFTYGPEIVKVFDNGAVFEPAVLDISEDQIAGAFMAGVSQVAAVCLAVDYPTLVSIPHSIINGYKNVLSISLATDYTYPLAEELKNLLNDPEAMAKAIAAAAAAATAAPAAAAESSAAAPEPEPEEEEEEEEEDMDFDLFD
jgi:large subunit ribosomal protein LP0